MMIDDAIRNSEFDHQIFSLFAAYIESVQSGVGCLEQLTNQPITGLNDLRARFRQLMLELDQKSTHAGDKSPVMKQALYIYGEALSRLQFLDEKKSRSIEEHVREHSASYVYRGLSDTIAA
jgi:hypothetical protein